MFYVASLSQFTISLTLQSAYILNGAKWVGHPPGKNCYDYFHDFVIVMHVFNRMQLAFIPESFPKMPPSSQQNLLVLGFQILVETLRVPFLITSLDY